MHACKEKKEKKREKNGISAAHCFPCLAMFLTTGNGAAKAGIKTTAVLRCCVDYARLGRTLLCKFTTHYCFNGIHQRLSLFFVTIFAFSTSRYSASVQGKSANPSRTSSPEEPPRGTDGEKSLFEIAVKSLYYNSPTSCLTSKRGVCGEGSGLEAPSAPSSVLPRKVQVEREPPTSLLMRSKCK